MDISIFKGRLACAEGYSTDGAGCIRPAETGKPPEPHAPCTTVPVTAPVKTQSDPLLQDLLVIGQLAVINVVEKLAGMLARHPRVGEIRCDRGPLHETAERAVLEYPLILAVTTGFRVEGRGLLVLAFDRSSLDRLPEELPPELAGAIEDPEELIAVVVGEMANLMGSTFLDVFSEVSGRKMLPTPPGLWHGETGEAPQVIARAYIEGDPAMDRDILLLQARIEVEDSPMEPQLIALFPRDSAETFLAQAREHLPSLFT